MIVNFYKAKYGSYRNCELLISKNVEHVPNNSMFIDYKGQHFKIDRVYFNVDKCEYDIYISRV